MNNLELIQNLYANLVKINAPLEAHEQIKSICNQFITQIKEAEEEVKEDPAD